jgi:hypothetical protein
MPGLSQYGRYAPVGTVPGPPSQAVTPCGGSPVPVFREFARLYADDEVLEGGLDFGKVQGDSG